MLKCPLAKRQCVFKRLNLLPKIYAWSNIVEFKCCVVKRHVVYRHNTSNVTLRHASYKLRHYTSYYLQLKRHVASNITASGSQTSRLLTSVTQTSSGIGCFNFSITNVTSSNVTSSNITISASQTSDVTTSSLQTSQTLRR